jgi:hypothetical protein
LPFKINQSYQLMLYRSDALKRLFAILEQLNRDLHAKQVDWNEIRAAAESFLLEIHVQQFMDQQSDRATQIQVQLEERIRKESAKSSIESVAPKGNTPDPLPEILGEEIKVLPDPEGPPVPIAEKTFEASNTPNTSTAGEEKDRTKKSSWNLGLNDRIALTKNLFEGNDSDLNRVLSQLESFNDIEEARSFLQKIVQLDCERSGAQEHLERLLELVDAYYQHRK